MHFFNLSITQLPHVLGLRICSQKINYRRVNKGTKGGMVISDFRWRAS